MSPAKEETRTEEQPVKEETEVDVGEMTPAENDANKDDSNTDKADHNSAQPQTKPDAEMTTTPTSVDHNPAQPQTKPDAEMTTTPTSVLETHESTVSAIRAALTSTQPPEQAAAQALKAASSHRTPNAILLSTLNATLPTLSLDSALQLIDVSIHLPHPPRNTLHLIESLTKTLTTTTLSVSLPLLQPRIDAIRRRPKSDLFLIKLLRSFGGRDPHAADPVLAGKLRLLVASALPAWHPSGMNKRGQYNKHVLPPTPTPTDPSLARALQAVSDACRYPPRCEEPAGWTTARDGLRILLDAFDVGQLKEIQTRICVQAAVLFQHLEFDGGSFGKSLFAGGEGVVLRRRVWERLEPRFKRFFTVLLQRERRWVRWKKTMAHTKVPKVEIGKVFKRRVIQKQNGRGLAGRNPTVAKPSWQVLKERTSEGGVKTLIEELKEDQKEAEEDRRKNDGKYVWRGLRSLCEENVSLMAKVAESEGKIDLERILSEKVSE